MRIFVRIRRSVDIGVATNMSVTDSVVTDPKPRFQRWEMLLLSRDGLIIALRRRQPTPIRAPKNLQSD